MNLIEITTQSYNAGLAGLPEPAKVTKHVQVRDGDGITLTAQVETEASLRSRLAWAQGAQNPAQLFDRWIEARLTAVERRLDELNLHRGACDWLCMDDCRSNPDGE